VPPPHLSKWYPAFAGPKIRSLPGDAELRCSGAYRAPPMAPPMISVHPGEPPGNLDLRATCRPGLQSISSAQGRIFPTCSGHIRACFSHSQKKPRGLRFPNCGLTFERLRFRKRTGVGQQAISQQPGVQANTFSIGLPRPDSQQCRVIARKTLLPVHADVCSSYPYQTASRTTRAAGPRSHSSIC